MPRKKKRTPEQLMHGIDFPHLRSGAGEWKEENNRQFVLHQIRKLQDLGMEDSEIQVMIADLYWNAFDEYLKNATIQRNRLL